MISRAAIAAHHAAAAADAAKAKAAAPAAAAADPAAANTAAKAAANATANAANTAANTTAAPAAAPAPAAATKPKPLAYIPQTRLLFHYGPLLLPAPALQQPYLPYGADPAYTLHQVPSLPAWDEGRGPLGDPHQPWQTWQGGLWLEFQEAPGLILPGFPRRERGNFTPEHPYGPLPEYTYQLLQELLARPEPPELIGFHDPELDAVYIWAVLSLNHAKPIRAAQRQGDHYLEIPLGLPLDDPRQLPSAALAEQRAAQAQRESSAARSKERQLQQELRENREFLSRQRHPDPVRTAELTRPLAAHQKDQRLLAREPEYWAARRAAAENPGRMAAYIRQQILPDYAPWLQETGLAAQSAQEHLQRRRPDGPNPELHYWLQRAEQAAPARRQYAAWQYMAKELERKAAAWNPEPTGPESATAPSANTPPPPRPAPTRPPEPQPPPPASVLPGPVPTETPGNLTPPPPAPRRKPFRIPRELHADLAPLPPLLQDWQQAANAGAPPRPLLERLQYDLRPALAQAESQALFHKAAARHAQALAGPAGDLAALLAAKAAARRQTRIRNWLQKAAQEINRRQEEQEARLADQHAAHDGSWPPPPAKPLPKPLREASLAGAPWLQAGLRFIPDPQEPGAFQIQDAFLNSSLGATRHRIQNSNSTWEYQSPIHQQPYFRSSSWPDLYAQIVEQTAALQRQILSYGKLYNAAPPYPAWEKAAPRLQETPPRRSPDRSPDRAAGAGASANAIVKDPAVPFPHIPPLPAYILAALENLGLELEPYLPPATRQEQAAGRKPQPSYRLQDKKTGTLRWQLAAQLLPTTINEPSVQVWQALPLDGRRPHNLYARFAAALDFALAYEIEAEIFKPKNIPPPRG